MLEIYESKFMPPLIETIWYSDWRQRLHRNLSRSSTGKWEPLYYEKHNPAFLIFNQDALTLVKNKILVLPKGGIAAIKNAIL